MRGAPTPARRGALHASRFDTTEMAPPDPILGVSEAFKASTSPNKLNLGVGAYRTEELQPLVLNCVRKAELKIAKEGGNHEYLPIEGYQPFLKATVALLLGTGAASNAAKEVRGRHKQSCACCALASLTPPANSC